MRNLRIPLAAAAALLLAAMPAGVSADSNQQCRSEWNNSTASDTCPIVKSIVWQSWSEKCRIQVTCTKFDGFSQKNDVTVNLDLVQHYLNCNGVLKQTHC